MKILITGNGLVGKNLLVRLQKEGHEVHVISRKDIDLRDQEKTRLLIEAYCPEVIYHTAANAAEARGQVSPIDMTQNNLNIFLNVLVPAINVKVKRFIYTSSVAVYGDLDVPYAEDDIPKPKDIYGVNKLAAEQILKILAKVHNFNYTIFRPHNIYGPSQDMSNPYKNVVALFMRSIIENKELTIFGEGKMLRAFSYIDDVIDVLVDSLNEKYSNQTLNLGSSIETDIKTLLTQIEAISGKKAKVKELPARSQEIYHFLASHKKLNSFYDYHETPLQIGLQKTWQSLTLPNLKDQYNEIN